MNSYGRMKNLKEAWLRSWHGQKDYDRIYGTEQSAHVHSNFIKFASIADLTDALIRAKDAHTQFERTNGPDANWPLWYAAYLALEQGMDVGVEHSVCKNKKCIIPSPKIEPKEMDEEEYWKAHS